jgi:hypothetical protein
MHEMIERILQRHAVAQVLVVHGWHVIQPRCDVGVGARLAQADQVHAVAPRLTVSPDYVLGALEALRAAGERHGIRTTYGERWPAAHRNNVLQLFRQTRPAVAGSELHPLGRLAASGRVQAVQLELGAPLRWPGPWRERFLDSAGGAFAAPVRRGTTGSRRRLRACEHGQRNHGEARRRPRRQRAAGVRRGGRPRHRRRHRRDVARGGRRPPFPAARRPAHAACSPATSASVD